MRLFVALDLSDAVRTAIAKFCETLRAEFPSARWVRSEGIHVTLKFIGEVEDDRVEKIENALSTVVSNVPVEMNFRGTGFFPNERRPRVFWIGIECDAESRGNRCAGRNAAGTRWALRVNRGNLSRI